ncbi:MAG: sugar phosphate isomerase/epimerase family protein [Deltaproteobacteria bacterium]|nr:sugar phosphate isomerase/epimerase family protein [Deltaproteobacteria bacterium]
MMNRNTLGVLVGSLTLWQATALATPDIQIGRCGGPKDLESSAQMGFDYVELPVRELATMTDDAFAAFQTERARIALPTPVGNLFLPSELHLTGTETDQAAQQVFVEKALARAASTGIKIVVFGSGGARKVPDGFSPKKAFMQLVAFGKKAARIAKKHGITIAVEPLRKQECNIINTAAEGLKLVKAIAHPNFQLMVDMYHMASEHEDPSIIVKAKKHIRHFHIANPAGRRFPLDAKEYDYEPFFRAVRTIGYSGGISVEASSDDPAKEAPQTIAFLRQLASGIPPAAP